MFFCILLYCAFDTRNNVIIERRCGYKKAKNRFKIPIGYEKNINHKKLYRNRPNRRYRKAY